MADALSIVEFQALSCDYDDNFDLILEEIGVDSVLSGVVWDLQANPKSHLEYSINRGCLWHKGRIVLSFKSTSIPMILHEFYSSP